MSAEPTTEQRAAAKQVVRDITGEHELTIGEHSRSVDQIARALAAAVTAERKKADTRVALALQQQRRAYETVAKEVEARMKATEMALVSGNWAARRIREVSR